MRKKILIVLGIIGIGTMCSFALTSQVDEMHKHHDPAKMVKMKVQKLTELLNLTADQQTKVEAIGMKYANQMKSAMETGNREEMHAKMKGNMDKIHAEIKAILTPEQVAKFENLDFAAMHKGHGHGHHMDGMHDKMKGLHEQLKPDFTAKRIAFDTKLTDAEQKTIAEVRKVMPSKEEMHSKMTAFKKECMAECKGDLSKEDHIKMKEKFKAKYAEMKTQAAPLTAIIDNHEADLKIIFKEMKVLATAKFGDEIPEHAKKMMSKYSEEHFEMMANHFLLLETISATITAIEISTFPNPAAEIATVSYELDEAQEVKVSILNAEGVLLKQVFSGSQEKGLNEIKVELNTLKSTDFFIVQVEANGKVGTNKILIQK
jgi:Spy/CpxP family protein refolding chaperone